jgi:major membrane immunogen (membrane-anchored lipoprotein)
MRTLKLLLLPMALLLLVACNKDQKVVNQLEGKWKVTGSSENGVAMPDSTFSNSYYEFEKCKIKDGACPGTYTEDGKALAFTYDIKDDGKKMVVTILGIADESEILENSKTKFKWRSTDGPDVTETTIEKQ